MSPVPFQAPPARVKDCPLPLPACLPAYLSPATGCPFREAKEARLSLLPCAMSEPEDEAEACWSDLESFRVKLISVIDPSRITPYLRQCKVISHDDEEQVLNDPSLVIRKRKAGGAPWGVRGGGGKEGPQGLLGQGTPGMGRADGGVGVPSSRSPHTRTRAQPLRWGETGVSEAPARSSSSLAVRLRC